MLGMFVSSVVVAFAAGALCFGAIAGLAFYNRGYQQGYARGYTAAVTRGRLPYTRLETGR